MKRQKATPPEVPQATSSAIKRKSAVTKSNDDAHSSFMKFVESSKETDEAFLRMQHIEKQIDPFFRSCSDRMPTFNAANQAWIRLKVSEILYQAEMYELNAQNTNNYSASNYSQAGQVPYYSAYQ